VIAASETFREASVTDVLEYVRDEFVAAQPLWDEVPIVVRGEDGGSDDAVGEFDTVSYALRRLSSQSFGSITSLRSPKTFRANRDTLGDVMGWLSRTTDVTCYFQTREDGTLSLVADASPTADSFQAMNLGGNVTVRNNNALYEISPRNALIYKGRSKSSLASVGDFELTMPSDKYPSIEVYHEPSVQRASGQKFYGRIVEGEAINLAEAEQEAKQTLKERMDGSSGGRIECAISPFVRPYATLDATPACNGELESEVPAYTYEIEEVTHTVTASNGARTDLRVAPLVSTDDMVVETSAMKAK
jgi:hypothetical protein